MTGSSKHVLLIHRFFYPDSPPYALILDDVRELLVNNGCIVDVLSSLPSYKMVDKDKKEKFISRLSKRSRIFRLPVFRFKSDRVNKSLNFFWFPIATFFFVLLGRSYNVITVSTAPPVILAFLVALAVRIRGGKLIYHCMDIHPEIGRIAGDFENTLIFKLLMWMDKFVCKTAAKVVVLSSDMKASLRNRGGDSLDNIEVVNNYDLANSDEPNKSFFDLNANKKRVVFTGNIGRFQNLEIFISALKGKRTLKNFELIFVGEGVALSKLKQMADGMEEMVKFIPHQSISTARKIISEADFGIVSLQNNVISYAYPSKTMTYLAEGTPIIVSVGSDAEITKFITAKKIGAVLQRPKINEVYDVFKQVNDGVLRFDRAHVKGVFDKHFSKKEFERKFGGVVFDQLDRA